jgi:hypothetical protein
MPIRSAKAILPTAAKLRRFAVFAVIGLLAAGPGTVALAGEAPPVATSSGAPLTGSALTTWAMHWFTEMMAGRTDRSQYSASFAPEVTDQAVAGIAHDLNRYGAAPMRAEIVQTKADGDQTFATIKFVFPRGDATSLLFGFDAAGKITGVAPGGIAGD